MSIFMTGLDYKITNFSLTMTSDMSDMITLRKEELYKKHVILYDLYKMYVTCKSCGKEFNDLVKGAGYSSVTMGNLLFCSDNCCKNYLNSTGKQIK
jgi:hypothetical protein